MSLPTFRYHPDPVKSGGVAASGETCRCCKEARGYIYAGPTYAEDDLENALCPWCIADGSAHKKFDVLFVDTEAFAEGTPAAAVEEISQRTPGYHAWQMEHWPACCGDATAYLRPVGIAEVRSQLREIEGQVMAHIVHDMGVSGGAATRMLNVLDAKKGPTLYLFQCLTCRQYHFHVDQP